MSAWEEVDAFREAAKPKPAPKAPKKPTTRRPMTPGERSDALALGMCRFAPATFDKRFARDLRARAQDKEPLITDAQAVVLARLAHRYRKQIAVQRAQHPSLKRPLEAVSP
jgi:hypothetical protein